LPGIPTEAEVKENGIEVGEMQAKLLLRLPDQAIFFEALPQKMLRMLTPVLTKIRLLRLRI
jgi:hypothetical protein